MYNDPTAKPWNSRSWAPPGFSSRRDLVEQAKAAENHKPLASGALEEHQIENATDLEKHQVEHVSPTQQHNEKL